METLNNFMYAVESGKFDVFFIGAFVMLVKIMTVLILLKGEV